jgi:hypothetical protein
MNYLADFVFEATGWNILSLLWQSKEAITIEISSFTQLNLYPDFVLIFFS